jgi:hypothetical protein
MGQANFTDTGGEARGFQQRRAKVNGCFWLDQTMNEIGARGSLLISLDDWSALWMLRSGSAPGVEQLAQIGEFRVQFGFGRGE